MSDLACAAARQNRPELKIASIVRTFGLYIPPGSRAHSVIDAEMAAHGFPAWFNTGCGGKVILCLEDCRNAATSLEPSAPEEEKENLLQHIITRMQEEPFRFLLKNHRHSGRKVRNSQLIKEWKDLRR
jgi:hypothetical protein